MAIAGRKPRADRAQLHNPRNRPVHEWVEVVDVPYEGPWPSLPRRAGGWPARTRRWWRVISTMPHCVLWTDADWQYALDVAEAHARYVEGQSSGTELRIREKALGNTMDARRDLRIRYVAPPDQGGRQAQEPAEVVNLDDYRGL